MFAITAPAAAASPLLPDMGMAKLNKITIDTTTLPGSKLLRYTARMVNVGAGPVELIGSRPDTSTLDMSVMQMIYDSSGSFSESPVNTYMYYAGDGHNHWHVHDIESGSLTSMDNGHQVGVLAKEGFCFSDNAAYNLALPGAPQTKVYTGAGCDPNNPSALTADMGLSIGWADVYGYMTNLQWIDITGVPDGRYLLTATADPGDVLQESNYSNNSVWAKIRITGNTVTVLKYGPGA